MTGRTGGGAEITAGPDSRVLGLPYIDTAPGGLQHCSRSCKGTTKRPSISQLPAIETQKPPGAEKVPKTAKKENSKIPRVQLIQRPAKKL